MQQRLHCTGIIYQLKQDRMCNCNTVTRDAITIAIWSGHPPRHPCAVCGQKKPPGDGGKQKIICMNSLNDVSESNFAASRLEKQVTPDALRRSLAR